MVDSSSQVVYCIVTSIAVACIVYFFEEDEEKRNEVLFLKIFFITLIVNFAGFIILSNHMAGNNIYDAPVLFEID